MNTHSTLKRLGRIEYAIVRTSMNVVDERLLQQFLGRESAARQSFGRAIDLLDDAAARWLQEPTSTTRDEQPTAAEAAPQDVKASPHPRPSQEPADVQPAEDAPAVAHEPDEDEQIEELTDELLEEQQVETFSGELADDDELRRVQAELNAKRLVEEQHSEHPHQPES